MQRLLIALLDAYKEWISPLLPSACRFHPTCSVYAREAMERFGAARGCWLAARRLARCHPFHPGGIDPVPARDWMQAGGPATGRGTAPRGRPFMPDAGLENLRERRDA